MKLHSADDIRIEALNDAVLLIHASWSGPALANCSAVIEYLNGISYTGRVILIDNDSMGPDSMLRMFGQIGHGWGEIFIVNNGAISNSFTGKLSYKRFKAFVNEQIKRKRVDEH